MTFEISFSQMHQVKNCLCQQHLFLSLIYFTAAWHYSSGETDTAVIAVRVLVFDWLYYCIYVEAQTWMHV